MLYKYFLEGSSPELTGFLQTAPDGSSMPAVWMSLNSVKDKLKTLVGEMESRGYEIKVRALNKEAISRKLEEKERLRVERKLRPSVQYAEKAAGVKLQKDEYIPDTDKELDEYIDLTFKDKAEIIMEAALKFVARYSDWDDKRNALFKDVLIANRAIVKNEIIRGVPQPRRIDPLKFFFDPNSTDDMLSDSTYFGEVEYMPLASAAERYGLTIEELQQAQASYNDFLGANGQGDAGFSSMPNNVLKWFKLIDGTPRCLVIKACWRDYKVLNHKDEEVEKHGVKTQHFQDLGTGDIRERDKDKIVTNKMECWRQGTVIGGTILKEWGECPNQPRDLSTLSKSEPPYKVWIPDFLIGKSVSMLEQVVGLQLLKDISMYHVQLAMARSAGKVLILDEAYMPDGWSKEAVTSHLKTDGISWVNSKEQMMNTGTVNFMKDFDLTLSESIGQYFTIMQYLDSQISVITGVTPERQGQVQGVSQAVGVTQSAIVQSNLTTAPYFKGFERFCAKVLNHQAKLIKIAWADNTVFAPIIGDTGIDFLKNNVDIDLDEFGVFVESLPPMLLDRQQLERSLDIYLQSSQGDPQVLADVLAIRLEPDTKNAIRAFQRKLFKRVQMQAEQQQVQSQQEQANLQADREAAFRDKIATLEGQLQLQDKKNEGSTERQLIGSRTKLNDTKLKMLDN